ncbi:MAG: YitT family protein, partial [Culicoidibacterales bacterium]
YNITEGGVLGLLLFFKNVFEIEPGFTNLVIDGLLFLVGMRFFGKHFIIYSLLATVSFSIFYTSFASIGSILPVFSSKLVVTILAGTFVGVGVGLIIRAGAAAGGDDVIALLVEKYTRLKIGHVYLITDVIVLTLSSVYLAPNELFWSIGAVLISGRIINRLFYWQNTTVEATN